MEKRSGTESSEILGDWDLSPSVNLEEGIVRVSVPTSPGSEDTRPDQPKEIESRVSDKERGMTSTAAAAKRVLPPWMEPSYEWGGGKWKEDGRKKKKKKKKKKENERIPFKEIIEALLRNSGHKVEEEDKDKRKGQSCVEMLKSMGFNFPL